MVAAASGRWRPARLAACWGIGGLLATMATVSSAHPHNWIDLRVSVVLNDRGEVTALEQRWLKDPLLSTLWLEDIVGDGADESREARLQEAADELLANIAGHGYFTRVEHGERSIEGHEAREPRIETHERRLELQFVLDLPEPLDPGEAPVRYAVFDPTYYIEILHAESQSIRLEGGGMHCDVRIEEPSPDPEKVAYAASLEVHEDPDSDLGRHFAEWAEIVCER